MDNSDYLSVLFWKDFIEQNSYVRIPNLVVSEHNDILGPVDLARLLMSSSKDCTSMLKLQLELGILDLRDIYNAMLNCDRWGSYHSIIGSLKILLDANMIDSEFAHIVVESEFTPLSDEILELLSPFFEYPLKWSVLYRIPPCLIRKYYDIDNLELNSEILCDFIRKYDFTTDDFSRNLMNNVLLRINSNTDESIVLFLGLSFLYNPSLMRLDLLFDEYVSIVKNLFGENPLLKILSYSIEIKGLGALPAHTCNQFMTKMCDLLIKNNYITSLPMYDCYAAIMSKLNDNVSDRFRKYHKYIGNYVCAWPFMRHLYSSFRYSDILPSFAVIEELKRQCEGFRHCASDHVKALELTLDQMENDAVLNEYIDSHNN